MFPRRDGPQPLAWPLPTPVLDVKPCPTCGREIAEPASVCEACEAWAAALVQPASEPVAAPLAEAPAPEGQSLVVAPAAAPVQNAASRRRLMLVAAGVVGAIGLTGFAMSARGGGSPAAPVAAANPSVPVPSASSAAPRPAAVSAPSPAAAPSAVSAVQTWSTDNHGAWLDDPRRGAAFELLSENTIKTWVGPVRPSLVVRCAAKSVEAFVVTGSPLKIDPRVDGKIVTLSVDGEPARTEHWVDSDRHTAVFAPDAQAFVARLRGAQTLQVGYSPHNSTDVVAQFHVAGLDALMVAAAKHCDPAEAVTVPRSRTRASSRR